MRFLSALLGLIGPIIMVVAFVVLVKDPQVQENSPLYNPVHASVIQIISLAGGLIFLISVVYQAMINRQAERIDRLERELQELRRPTTQQPPLDSFVMSEEEPAKRSILAEVEAQDSGENDGYSKAL